MMTGEPFLLLYYYCYYYFFFTVITHSANDNSGSHCWSPSTWHQLVSAKINICIVWIVSAWASFFFLHDYFTSSLYSIDFSCATSSFFFSTRHFNFNITAICRLDVYLYTVHSLFYTLILFDCGIVVRSIQTAKDSQLIEI